MQILHLSPEEFGGAIAEKDRGDLEAINLFLGEEIDRQQEELKRLEALQGILIGRLTSHQPEAPATAEQTE